MKFYRANIRQIFIADDFFGRTEYEPIRVSEWQSELAHIIPLLDQSHWLVLTCRAHLLEMAKSELDIAGQNHRFPILGEVVVNAGKLRIGEKARILYRHAKALGLSQIGKEIVRLHASLIVKHPHFTPERIRRLVEELVPKLALEGVSAQALKKQISEALSNPTKQMRVSFHKLSVCHRWLLFALLEADRESSVPKALGGSSWSLQKRYEVLCPQENQQPFIKVLNELSEAFIKKSASMFETEIDWIHPSCRDLAIEELVLSPQDRHRFLSHCSESGLFLATSSAGGATGARDLPLLANDTDWADFALRACELLQERANVLRIIWFNYEQLMEKAEEKGGPHGSVLRLKVVIEKEIIPTAKQHITSFAYSDSKSFRTYFQICQKLDLAPSIDLSEVWPECIGQARRWLDERWVIWQDDTTPGHLADFLRTLQEFYPSELQKTEVREKLQCVLADLLARADDEESSQYDDPEDSGEIVERADAFDTVGKAFKQLSELTIWNEKDRESLKRSAWHFDSEAENLREGLPQEPDADGDSSYERSSGEDMDIDELFRDL